MSDVPTQPLKEVCYYWLLGYYCTDNYELVQLSLSISALSQDKVKKHFHRRHTG